MIQNDTLRIRMNQRGFTLLEIVMVVLILGVSIVMFYGTLNINWVTFDQNITRADIWQEINSIVRQATEDARESSTIALPTATTANFLDINNNMMAIYSITPGGQLQRNVGGVITVLSDMVDSAGSSFVLNAGGSLVMNLAMRGDTFGSPIDVATAVEIFPRN